MREPVTAYIGLGANLGLPEQALRAALDRIARLPLTALVRRSSLYRSAPVDAGGPDYINAVAEISTGLTAPELLAQLQRIEADAGRERPYRNAPRTLDLDLLLFGAASIASASLQVPHPRMHERAFVLVPLAEIAPQCVSEQQLRSVSGQAIARLPAR
ncbi:2-amino-4-hydroxy-6-hydroxymethyldihydropteridine diphosphokinase [Ramlibacter solisilvae]|uniref:2-amino-4-hydroxy-6-hydroxymethyldihydropteridine pyrophosphokinase n=1 Tax=Ramlibacter tataouinensis TaxID=94132 RepID=A0A127JVI7_9BURK|nr:2-amino-4-hydroxy-6-hydroxymethyldihydropteridine diphosphokinase [Ramlibacter tataouinensis]AMO22032.1 2-amino-4-hydroxy-6-hydroxymethyldihydropteridine pyrophosphokinase [Ramlibacter tataouinensis]